MAKTFPRTLTSPSLTHITVFITEVQKHLSTAQHQNVTFHSLFNWTTAGANGIVSDVTYRTGPW